MKLKDNFSEVLLLSEQPVMFYTDDPMIPIDISSTMKLITVAESFTHPYIQYAIALLNLDTASLQKTFRDSRIANLWSMLNLVGLGSDSYIHRCSKFLFSHMFGSQFQATEEKWTINNIILDDAWFCRIQEIILITNGIRKFADQEKFHAHKPQWLREKEAEIQRIKNGGKKQSGGEAHYNELLRTLVPLCYEFNYTLEQLFDMNYFHIQALSSYIPRIVAYDLGKRQVFAKKAPKYITEK